MTRTFVLGKASEKQKEIYNVVLKAQLAGLAAVKAGVSGSSVDKSFQRYYRRGRIRRIFRTWTWTQRWSVHP